MAGAVLASLALHGSLIWPFLSLNANSQPRQKTDKLLVELFGMVAERQKEASAPSAAAAPATPARAAQVVKKRRATPRQELPKPVYADLPAPLTEEEQAPSSLAPAADGNASQLQKQQTLQARDETIAALKRYLAALKKQIQAKLAYPEEGKRAGYEGTSLIRFIITESGAIRPGSLSIARSSGHEMLDANALQAAQSSAPFAVPSREMEVVISIGFGSDQ